MPAAANGRGRGMVAPAVASPFQGTKERHSPPPLAPAGVENGGCGKPPPSPGAVTMVGLPLAVAQTRRAQPLGGQGGQHSGFGAAGAKSFAKGERGGGDGRGGIGGGKHRRRNVEQEVIGRFPAFRLGKVWRRRQCEARRCNGGGERGFKGRLEDKGRIFAARLAASGGKVLRSEQKFPGKPLAGSSGAAAVAVAGSAAACAGAGARPAAADTWYWLRGGCAAGRWPCPG